MLHVVCTYAFLFLQIFWILYSTLIQWKSGSASAFELQNIFWVSRCGAHPQCVILSAGYLCQSGLNRSSSASSSLCKLMIYYFNCSFSMLSSRNVSRKPVFLVGYNWDVKIAWQKGAWLDRSSVESRRSWVLLFLAAYPRTVIVLNKNFKKKKK